MIALRRQGLSIYEISARLADEGTPLNRTSVAEILTEEGFGRLLRRPADRRPPPRRPPPAATPGCPATAVLDFTTWPDRARPAKAGLLLLLPDLVALDLPALVAPPATPAPGSCPPPAGCCPCWR